MRTPKKFITQVRRRGQPTVLKLVDVSDAVYRLAVCTNMAEEGLLSLDRDDCDVHYLGLLLDRHMANELAEALLRYASTGFLVPKRRRPLREICRWCKKKSVDPRASWTEPNHNGEGLIRFSGPKCTTKGCDYREGKWVRGFVFPKSEESDAS